MFTKLPGRIMPMAYRRASSAVPSLNFTRLFSTSHIPSPHSPEHLQLQQKLFKLNNQPTHVTSLPRGTEFIGLNITPAEPHFLGTAPVYNPEILKAISHSEKQGWLEMAKNYYAQISKYELLCDLDCVTTKSENGIPIHYIDHSLLEPKSYTPIEKILDLDRAEVTMKK